MNTRIDEEIKARGDAVFAHYGYTPSQVVNLVWAYAAEHQALPPFFARAGKEGGRRRSAAALERGYGAAVELACEAGITLDPLIDASYETLRDAMYEDMLDEYEAQHV